MDSDVEEAGGLDHLAELRVEGVLDSLGTAFPEGFDDVGVDVLGEYRFHLMEGGAAVPRQDGGGLGVGYVGR